MICTRFPAPILAAVLEILCWSSPSFAGEEARAAGGGVPLFEDTSFRRGFHLSFPSSARGRAAEKELRPEGAAADPVWQLCQWATRRSLAAAPLARQPDGAIAWENETKRVLLGLGKPDRPDLVLDVRGGAEYQGRARKAGEPWPHLLVEQDAVNVRPLDRLARIDLAIGLRRASFRDSMEGRADPSLHAAQFQLFFIVKEIGPGSSGDFFWFGVPFFDSRSDFPPAYRAKDGGKDDATGKYIFTIDGKEVLPEPLTRGRWVEVRKDLLPSILAGVASAVQAGYLKERDPDRYAVVNMNMGWEIPGAFDAAVEVRGLSITAVPRERS